MVVRRQFTTRFGTLEVESLLVLKNNRGVEDNRVRHMDYGVQLNKLMYQRLIKRRRYYFIQPVQTYQDFMKPSLLIKINLKNFT